MLRSWTRRIGLENDQSIGVALSRSNLCAVAVSGTDANTRIDWVKQTAIEKPLFASESAQTLDDSLSKALRPVLDSINDKPRPIHIVLPDIIIRSTTFELTELPKSRQTLSSLALWRMAEELGRNEKELVCQTMSLGNDNGKQLLYVQAGDRNWLKHIKSVFDGCGITPWSINSASHFRYNYLNCNNINASSAMLSVDDDCWSIQIWDSDTRIRLTVTRLRRSSQADNDIDLIFSELTRVLRAWQVNHPDFRFNTLYLDGSEECAEAIKARSSGHFNEIVIMRMNSVDQANIQAIKSPLMGLAAMAAVTE